MLELIDSHCHLDFPVFDAERPALIERCNAVGIQSFIVPGVEAVSWPRLIQLRTDFPGVHIAFGLHPYFIENHQLQDIEKLKQFCEKFSPIAIGEIGLDFYRKDLPKEKQITFFQAQLQVAEALKLPVILHVRKAHQDVLQMLKHYQIPGGIAHAFNGSYEQALQYIDLGFKLGFGGALTLPNARKLHSLAENLSLQSIVLETDSPDMKPANYLSAYNTPLSLLQTLDTLADIRGQSKAMIAKITSANIQSIIDV